MVLVLTESAASRRHAVADAHGDDAGAERWGRLRGALGLRGLQHAGLPRGWLSLRCGNICSNKKGIYRTGIPVPQISVDRYEKFRNTRAEVDCVVSAWQDWAGCSQTCGPGLRWLSVVLLRIRGERPQAERSC